MVYISFWWWWFRLLLCLVFCNHTQQLLWKQSFAANCTDEDPECCKMVAHEWSAYLGVFAIINSMTDFSFFAFSNCRFSAWISAFPIKIHCVIRETLMPTDIGASGHCSEWIEGYNSGIFSKKCCITGRRVVFVQWWFPGMNIHLAIFLSSWN